MRLSVFRGGFTREAAQDGAGAGLPILARLIGKCLLQFQPANERYQMHEVLRQYGQEKLASAGSMGIAVQHRHFEYYADIGRDCHCALLWHRPDRLARSAGGWNTTTCARPCLGCLPSRRWPSSAARLVIALAWFWRIHSHVLEGRTWLEQAVLLPDLTTETRAGLLYHAGHLAWMQDDFALAQARVEQSLELWQSLGPSGQRGAGLCVPHVGHGALRRRTLLHRAT